MIEILNLFKTQVLVQMFRLVLMCILKILGLMESVYPQTSLQYY